MGDKSQPDLGTLRALASEAKSGQLVLDPDIARECAAACETLMGELDAVRDSMKQLDRLLPLGDFNCGNDLSKKLREVAVGEGGFSPRLDEHIEAVKQIHDMVGAQVSALLTSDSTSAGAINANGTKLGG